MKYALVIMAALGCGGCASTIPTVAMVTKGTPAAFHEPAAICGSASADPFSAEALANLVGSMRLLGRELQLGCVGVSSYVRIRLRAANEQMTTHGPVHGRIEASAELEACRGEVCDATLILWRPDGVYLSAEMRTLARQIDYLFRHGSTSPDVRHR